MFEFIIISVFIVIITSVMMIIVCLRGVKSAGRTQNVIQRNNGLVYDVADEILDMDDKDIEKYVDTDIIMVIDDVFNLTGRGVAVTGTIINGNLQVGDEVKIQNLAQMSEISTIVTEIEKFRQSINVASIGDSVGVLLSGVSKSDIQKGDYIKK